MPECFCPEELGGACYFEPVTDELSDWMPTHEHSPRSKREGGHRDVDNAILAHRLCNRIDYSISVGRPYASDLERVRKAREEATLWVPRTPFGLSPGPDPGPARTASRAGSQSCQRLPLCFTRTREYQIASSLAGRMGSPRRR